MTRHLIPQDHPVHNMSAADQGVLLQKGDDLITPAVFKSQLKSYGILAGFLLVSVVLPP